MSDTDYSFLKKCSKFELTSRFKMACENGDIEKVKYILNETDCHIKPSSALVTACLNEQWELSKFLLFSEEIKENADVNYAKALPFRCACSAENLELVKLLRPLVKFDSPEFDENVASLSIRSACSSSLEITKFLLNDKQIFELGNIEEEGIEWLFSACQNGSLDIVKYLLTSTDLKENIVLKPDSVYESYLYICFEANHLDIAKYLLASTELKIHSNINNDNGEIFKILCETDSMEMLQWLIFDLGMKRTEYIDNYLKENPNDKITNWFKLSELNKELNTDLNKKNKNIGKFKI